MHSRSRIPFILVGALLAAPIITGCGSDSPTEPAAGSEMSVAEQVAIPDALDKVAAALEARGQAADSNLAGFTRVAAQLLARSGIQGTVVAANSRLQSADTMHAVAGLITQGSGVGALQLHYVVAWSGLDVKAFTVRRALVLLVDGSGKTTGTFSLAGPSATVTGRYVEPAASAIFDNAGGTLAVDSARFDGECTGAPSQGGVTCASGSESVGATFDGATAGGGTISLSWDPALLPTYHLTSTP